ncbi:hypothetical protein GCK32_009446 [Trichostrongylus colubriformis]|uniref:Uncharacterized protein n=1 Tax=Trichostrongylus colubriformis TaxID=6319 RepID=A0AAN8EX03_TRICO
MKNMSGKCGADNGRTNLSITVLIAFVLLSTFYVLILMAKKSRSKRRRMQKVKTGKEDSSLFVSTTQQVSSITESFASIFQILGSVSGPATKCLGDVLERSAAVLEELNTLNCSVTGDAIAIQENLRSIELQLVQLDSLWPSIDRTVEFVNQKKRQLTELERLCTSIELATRTGKRSIRRSRSQEDLSENVPNDGQESPDIVASQSNSENDSDSDSDAPVEISSKPAPDIKLLDEEPELSLFEQYQKKKKEAEERRQEKAQSKNRKRVKKVDRGQFVVKAKKAQFKVITLDEGVKKSLEPTVNFREELLRARTAGRREKGLFRLVDYRMPPLCVRNG